MSDVPSRSRFQFRLRWLFFLALCVAGLLGGYRVGYMQGYAGGVRQRLLEEPVVKTYDISDVVHIAQPGETSYPGALADFDSIIELLTSTVLPESWDEVGGRGSIAPHEDSLSIVVRQVPAVHVEIESVLKSLRENQQKAEDVIRDAITIAD